MRVEERRLGDNLAVGALVCCQQVPGRLGYRGSARGTKHETLDCPELFVGVGVCKGPDGLAGVTLLGKEFAVVWIELVLLHIDDLLAESLAFGIVVPGDGGPGLAGEGCGLVHAYHASRAVVFRQAGNGCVVVGIDLFLDYLLVGTAHFIGLINADGVDVERRVSPAYHQAGVHICPEEIGFGLERRERLRVPELLDGLYDAYGTGYGLVGVLPVGLEGGSGGSGTAVHKLIDIIPLCPVVSAAVGPEFGLQAIECLSVEVVQGHFYLIRAGIPVLAGCG